MSDAPLRAQDVRFVEEARGCNPVTQLMSPDDPAVYYGIELNPQDTACARGAPFDDACFYSWSWDLTRCSDMLPYSVQGSVASGEFIQVSSLAASKRIQVGTPFTLYLGPLTGATCRYTLVTPPYTEQGVYTWTRLMRADPNDGQGGANKQATIQFEPQGNFHKSWGSLWIARERYAGSWQSPLGIASFTLSDTLRPNSPCVPGGASNPNPTLFGLSDFK